jgi:predicted RNA-binding Zn ribbon-like protein
LEVIDLPGNICLDFANTVEWHAGPDPEERLTSYSVAVHWGREQGILSDAQERSLLAKARAHPEHEKEAMRRIIALREAVYRIFSAVAHLRLPESADLETLNAELIEASAHLRLVVAAAGPSHEVSPGPEGRPGFDWAWTGTEKDLTSLLWPVARAATVLLTSPQLAQVRECAGDPCGWLFLDLSKNGSRRWCDMADCGNRAKARRYRARKKRTGDAPQAGSPL